MAFTKILGPGIATDTNVQVGILTATKFYGDGSELTGVSATGLGTALSQDQTSPLNKIYYTDPILSIGSTITIDAPSSTNVAYTQYSEISIEDGADLIVEDGDDFITDVLGISTEGATQLSGAGGRIRADSFTNRAGTGAPSLKYGASIPVGYGLTGAGSINISGVVTATAFYGSGAYLTNVISGVEVKQDGTSVGTSITAINFSGATLSTPSAGLTTVTIAKQLTIGVRTGTAITFSLTGSSFNVSGRSGNILISI